MKTFSHRVEATTLMILRELVDHEGPPISKDHIINQTEIDEYEFFEIIVNLLEYDRIEGAHSRSGKKLYAFN